MGDQQITVRMLWSVCARYSSPEFGSQGWFAYMIYDNFDYLKRRKRKKPLTKFPSKKDKIDEVSSNHILISHSLADHLFVVLEKLFGYQLIANS